MQANRNACTYKILNYWIYQIYDAATEGPEEGIELP